MKDKLIIGEFNDSFMPVMDGVVNVLNNYTLELNKLGHRAYAIVPGYSEDPDYDSKNGITYAIRGREHYPLKSLKPYGITTFPHVVRKEIDSIPFDIVHAHCPTFSGEYAQKIAKRMNIPVVATFHTFFKDDLKELVPGFLAEQIVKKRMGFYYRCDEVWTPSEESRKRMQTEYNYTGETRVVENCADFVPPKDDEEFQERKRRGRGLCSVTDDTPILLFVGQHKDEKNIPLTLETIRTLKARGLKFRMVFVGEDTEKRTTNSMSGITISVTASPSSAVSPTGRNSPTYTRPHTSSSFRRSTTYHASSCVRLRHSPFPLSLLLAPALQRVSWTAKTAFL